MKVCGGTYIAQFLSANALEGFNQWARWGGVG
jgi:hypothetical protein